MKIVLCTAAPVLNLAYLDADLELSSVVHTRNTPYYNLGSESKSANPAHTAQARKCGFKMRFSAFSRQNGKFGKNVSNKSCFS